MRNGKVVKSAIVGSFTGLASIPGLFYALVVRPVQSVQSGVVKSAAKQDEILKNATGTGRILFGLGIFFLVVLVGYISIGIVAQEREVSEK